MRKIRGPANSRFYRERSRAQLAPAAGATVATPFFLDWSDTANPQIPGYEVDVNTSPTFADISSVLFLTPTRSDYMISAVGAISVEAARNAETLAEVTTV
jgi:hypothetical protein